MATLPLPPNTSGIPGPEDFGFEIASNTTPGMVPVGEEQIFILGHCGLISPIDIDGSLWDPIAGDNGQGGPLSEDQLGELINSTTVVTVLVDADTAMFVTPRGARIVLDRHDGPRSYFGCD